MSEARHEGGFTKVADCEEGKSFYAKLIDFVASFLLVLNNRSVQKKYACCTRLMHVSATTAS